MADTKTLREAAENALAVLVTASSFLSKKARDRAPKVIADLRAALAAQAQAEPVADERDEEIERLRDLVIRQGTQLERIVNIVRGDPAEGCAHSTHDAADLVYGLKMHSDQYAMAVEHEQRAAQPVRQPLTDEQRIRMFIDLNSQCAQADSPSAMFTVIVQAVERAHGITGEKA